MAIEADLMPLGYGLHDIPHRLRYRQLLGWLMTLPATSAIYQSMHGDRAVEWSQIEHRIADMADMLHLQLWQFAAAHTPKGQPRPSKPGLFPRPGVESTTPEGEHRIGSRGRPIAEIQAMLDQAAAAHQAGQGQLTEGDRII